ncbi:MAG: hypothetical protein JWQ16_3470 [Novosphingobium sp.]|jgi:hypothetical protein|nr:hypothetical protein [Novosphingobium sp.]
MRDYRLFTLAASLAMLLPLGAQAAGAAWPSGGRAQFVNECVSAASKDLGAASAKSHCDCAADTAEKKLSPAEMKTLNSPSAKGSPAVAKLMNEVGVACPTN